MNYVISIGFKMSTNLNNIPTGFALNQNPSTYDGDEIVTGFNDIFIDAGGNLGVVGGLNDLIQTVKNSLWLWIGEYDFDINIGLSYQGVFQPNNSNAAIFVQQIETSILQCNTYLTTLQYNTYGIKSVSSITFATNRQNRTVTINITLNLNNGQNLPLSITNDEEAA